MGHWYQQYFGSTEILLQGLRPAARHNRVLPRLWRRQRLHHRDPCHSAIVSVRGWLRCYLRQQQLRGSAFSRSPRRLDQFPSRKISDRELPDLVRFLPGANILIPFPACYTQTGQESVGTSDTQLCDIVVSMLAATKQKQNAETEEFPQK